METRTLKNGVTIPIVGFGTWQTPDGQVALCSVKKAIEYGYRHVDTAACYENEVGVGAGIAKAIANGTVSRDMLFVTSKVWNTERGYDKTMAAFEKTLSDLGLGYLDLYLIQPD
nr:PREDICTED: prostaglandin F synthase-like [Opisthocomus hoazin]